MTRDNTESKSVRIQPAGFRLLRIWQTGMFKAVSIPFPLFR